MDEKSIWMCAVSEDRSAVYWFCDMMGGKFYLPVVCDFISIAFPHVPIEKIEANVGDCSVHPFHENIAFGYIEIVRYEFSRLRWGLPIEFLRHFRPKCLWLLKRYSMHLFVFIEWSNARFFDHIFGRIVHARHCYWARCYRWLRNNHSR